MKDSSLTERRGKGPTNMIRSKTNSAKLLFRNEMVRLPGRCLYASPFRVIYGHMLPWALKEGIRRCV